MGLLIRSLAMLCTLVWFSWLPDLTAQSTSGPSRDSAQALDSLLQDYAYRAFVHPRTGRIYDGHVPSNLTGIQVAALRLRSGSLYRRGAKYKEFNLSDGVFVTPYVERLVLVYQNLGNRSEVYYPLDGYTFLAPVLGLLAYDASNLSAKNLPELNFRATRTPISIEFPNVDPAPSGIVPTCVRLDPNGSLSFNNVTSNNKCTAVEQGHFSIVMKYISPPPPVSREEEDNTKVWIIVGSVVGGIAVLALAALLVLWARKFQQKKRMRKMERAAEVGEALHMTLVGNTKAPAAMVTRTQPVLESEYVP